jgi:hypothetical protein
MSYKTRKIKEVIDSRTFRIIWLRNRLGCDRCRPHRGCNRYRRYNRHKTNWKLNRETQWKQMN